MGDAQRRAPADVAWVIEDSVVYLARVPQGPIHVLRGISGLIWDLATSGPRDSLAVRVAECVDQPHEVVAADVEAFVADLVDRGLVCP